MGLRERVGGCLSNCEALSQASPLTKPLTTALHEMMQRLDEPLRVAVVGIMKAGKSTFMNALMGTDIVLTGDTETTYTVGWFRYGETPSLTIQFRDGTQRKAPFEDLERWTVRASSEEDIQKVQYVIIHYPSEVLKELEFIDTPGLNSKYGTDAQNTLDFLSVQSSKDTVQEASRADAVLYAFNRCPTDTDRDILENFHRNCVESSPINAIGILTKVDAGGIWKVTGEQTPVEAAETVTQKTMESPVMRSLLFSTLPICALAVEGFEKLTQADWTALDYIATLDEALMKDKLLKNGERFLTRETPPFSDIGPIEVRKHLMDCLGQYGILEIALQRKEGKSQEEIKEILAEKCGMNAIRAMLLKHFRNRTFLIKCRFVFGYISSVIESLQASNGQNRDVMAICNQVEENIESIFDELQALRELNVLKLYYESLEKKGSYQPGVLRFDNQEVEDLMHITGEYGRTVEERLDLTPGSSFQEMEQRAKEKTMLWRAKGGCGQAVYRMATATITHSYEIMHYHLNALNDI